MPGQNFIGHDLETTTGDALRFVFVPRLLLPSFSHVYATSFNSKLLRLTFTKVNSKNGPLLLRSEGTDPFTSHRWVLFPVSAIHEAPN
jgi:hypothetical protein